MHRKMGKTVLLQEAQLGEPGQEPQQGVEALVAQGHAGQSVKHNI